MAKRERLRKASLASGGGPSRGLGDASFGLPSTAKREKDVQQPTQKSFNKGGKGRQSMVNAMRGEEEEARVMR